MRKPFLRCAFIVCYNPMKHRSLEEAALAQISKGALDVLVINLFGVSPFTFAIVTSRYSYVASGVVLRAFCRRYTDSTEGGLSRVYVRATNFRTSDDAVKWIKSYIEQVSEVYEVTAVLAA